MSATASPAGGQPGPGKPTLRYSEITPEMLRVLRIYAALESCYPQHGDRATRAVAGHAAWRAKRAMTPQAASTGPGMKQDQGLSSSQSHPVSTPKSAVHQSPCELKGRDLKLIVPQASRALALLGASPGSEPRWIGGS